MRATVSQWGNSLAIRIPRGVAQDAHLSAGAVVDLRVEDDRIVMEPVPEDTLSMLLDRITPANLHGEQLADAPIGREVW